MKEGSIKIAGVIIIILLLIAAIIASVSNTKNKHSLNEEKLQKESVISEKNQVSSELDKVKNELAALKTKNEITEKSLAETESKLAEKEKRIGYLSKENSSITKDKKELANLQKTKSELDKAFEDLKLEHQTSLARIRDLENSEIVLETEKKTLAVKLDKSEMYRTDNIEIYGSRGNKKDKLTFYACRTKEINLNFDVPKTLTEAISFKIVTPSGTTITPDDKSLSWTISQNPENLTASISSSTGEIEPSRQVTLTYSSKEKLASGEYKIQILSDNKNLSSCRLKLK
jgi:hypothetical protein